MESVYRMAVDELGDVMDRVDDVSVDRACRMIAGAGKIMLYGCGREGLQMRGLAMRLHHLGLRSSMQGDMSAPPLGKGDLFFVSAGPGELPTASALVDVARAAGVTVLLVTAQPEKSSIAARSDHVLVIPAQTMADDQSPAVRSVLPMGSVFEGSMFVLFEVMILKLRDMLGVTPETMRSNHTNME